MVESFLVGAVINTVSVPRTTALANAASNAVSVIAIVAAIVVVVAIVARRVTGVVVVVVLAIAVVIAIVVRVASIEILRDANKDHGRNRHAHNRSNRECQYLEGFVIDQAGPIYGERGQGGDQRCQNKVSGHRNERRIESNRIESTRLDWTGLDWTLLDWIGRCVE